MSRAILEALERHPYFASLPAPVLAAIAERTIVRVYARGAVLYAEGEPSPGLYVVESGSVRTFKSSPDGREQDLHRMTAGESFNDAAAFDGGPTVANAQAMEPTRVLHVSREELVDLLHRHPELAVRVVAVLATRLRELSDLAGDLSLRHVVARVARALLRLPAASDGSVTLPRVHELAARVGTVREVAARALVQLEASGAIAVGPRRRVTVVDRASLERLVGERWPTASVRGRPRAG